MTLEIKHSNIPQRLSETGNPIGSIPRADFFQMAAGMQSYMRNWAGGGLIFSTEFQPPDTTLNPVSTAAAPCHYYPIFFSPDRTGTATADRQLGGLASIWSASDSDANAIKWYPDYVPGTPGTPVILYAVGQSSYSIPTSYGMPLFGGVIQMYNGLDFDPNDGDWLVKRLSFEGLHVASVSIFHAPDGSLADDQRLVSQSDVTAGQVIRGYTGSGRRSVGDLFHLTGSETDTADDIERVTRRCMAQVGTAYGYYVGNGVTSYERVYGANFEFEVKPRPFSDIGSPETGELLPAFVVTGDEGCMIRVTNAENSDTWTYTIPAGGIANPTLVEPTDGTGTIDLGLTANSSIQIDAKTDTSKEMVIYTSSLWEGLA